MTKEINGWDEWAQKKQKATIIGGRKFVVQELTGDEYDKVKKIPDAVPPKKYQTDSKGQVVMINKAAQQEDDYDNPEYLAKVKEVENKRSLLILKYGLVEPAGTKIPGDTDTEKWAHIKKGMAGVIEKLTLAICRMSSLLSGDIDDLKE